MSTTQVIEFIKTLSPAERQKVRECLDELEWAEAEESPELLAALDEGEKDIREGRTHTPEEARAMIRPWISKSS